MDSEIRYNHVGPHFAVLDVSRAIAFYRDALGFQLEYLNGEPPHYAVVFHDDVYLHLSLSLEPTFLAGAGRAFVSVTGVDKVWEAATGAVPDAIHQALEDCDYGHGVRFRVFAIEDPDGNTLRIGEPLPG